MPYNMDTAFTIKYRAVMESFRLKAVDRATVIMVLLLFIVQFVFPHIGIELNNGVALIERVSVFGDLPYAVDPLVEAILKQKLIPVVLAAENVDYAKNDEGYYIRGKTVSFGSFPNTVEADTYQIAGMLESVDKYGAVMDAVVTAYNSEVAQTDDSPCITANGFNICEAPLEEQAIVANNCLGFNTKVSFPELNPNRIYVVKDRMNSRYDCSSVDIWLLDKQSAIDFGVKKLKMRVYPSGWEENKNTQNEFKAF